MSVWNSNPYRLLSKCLFGIPILAAYSPCSHCLLGILILTCFSPNVYLESQSLKATLQMSLWNPNPYSLLSMWPLSAWNSNPYMLLSKCLFGIQILTGFSPNVYLESLALQATLQMFVWNSNP